MIYTIKVDESDDFCVKDCHVFYLNKSIYVINYIAESQPFLPLKISMCSGCYFRVEQVDDY